LRRTTALRARGPTSCGRELSTQRRSNYRPLDVLGCDGTGWVREAHLMTPREAPAVAPPPALPVADVISPQKPRTPAGVWIEIDKDGWRR
jgi:hypothetical protein